MTAYQFAPGNCFGIPDTYSGYRITQGPDDRFYGRTEGCDWEDGDPEGDTWGELRDDILGHLKSRKEL